MKFYIWWVTGKDCKQIGEPHNYWKDTEYWKEVHQITMSGYVSGEQSLPGWVHDESKSDLPGYLLTQYSHRYGRAGRQRLWVDERFGEINIDKDHKNWSVVPEDAGGIVFAAPALEILKTYPGLITDFDLNVIK